MVVVSLAGTEVTDEDLKLFIGFPFVQDLDLSGTAVGDEGLSHLAHLPALETLNVGNTRISDEAIARFRESHPRLEITTETQPRGELNPFTGKPF